MATVMIPSGPLQGVKLQVAERRWRGARRLVGLGRLKRGVRHRGARPQHADQGRT